MERPVVFGAVSVLRACTFGAALLCIAGIVVAHFAQSPAAAEILGDGAFFCAVGALVFDWLRDRLQIVKPPTE